MMIQATALLTAAVCAASVPAAEGVTDAGWKAGAARADITPSEPVWMAGYGSRTKPAEGTLHKLWVKALALEDAHGRRAVVVTTDLLGLPRNLAVPICRRLRDELGLPRKAVMLTSSHTHCGPALRRSLHDAYPLEPAHVAVIERYSTWLEDQIVATVAKALDSLTPATVSGGDGHCTFAVNRRNNREADVPKLTTLKGPVDHSVPVLRVRRADGGLLAVLFGYACHNTTLSFYQWCGDYAGFAQLEIEKANPGATAMFFMGCGADQNPLPRRTVGLAAKYGRMLAASVQEVVDTSMRPLASALDMHFAETELRLAAPPSKDEFARMAAESGGYKQRWAKRLHAKLVAGQPLTRTYAYPVQVWRFGHSQQLIALGGEVVVDYALRLKKEFRSMPLWVAAYANDVMAYIPSARVLHEGGYEGKTSMVPYGLPAPWADDVEDRVMKAVRRLAK